MEPEGSLQLSQQPLAHVLIHIDPVHALQACLFKTHLILSSHLRLIFQVVSFLQLFPTKTLYEFLFSPIRATRPTNHILM